VLIVTFKLENSADARKLRSIREFQPGYLKESPGGDKISMVSVIPVFQVGAICEHTM
jgi:hypothetical protein